ncbi:MULTISPECIES: hypothetical protein [unclassified Xanthomonas]|nr:MULTISPECIES: hypothetical protein [unclassified Xanthomonas]MEA9564099.1 hypothetical protein [Xanthomonas sp. WHRI 8932A]MEA9587428.1 hypothetical protein [Xanthomonas sp. WHRI 10064B]MEA9615149.1 hypothetical protein [Xanthomonas sp. WHRI 10064A]MEA9635915.1 hypothetical protein [Xanthomonas sp. WHRI 8812E]
MPFEPTAAIDRGAPQLREIRRLQNAREGIGVATANSATTCGAAMTSRRM